METDCKFLSIRILDRQIQKFWIKVYWPEIAIALNTDLQILEMSKRGADEVGGVSLKAGQRPENGAQNGEGLDFEDDFEDEFESEDEVMEAGVDGRPDAERESEANKGKLSLLIPRM